MDLKLKQLHAVLQLTPEGIEEKELTKLLKINNDELDTLVSKLDKYFEDSAVNIVHAKPLLQLVVDSKYIPKNFELNTPDTTLGSAAMEVLTIIAYNQPIDALKIEKIRGINSEQSIRNLLEKELIAETRVKEKGINFTRYITTKHFLHLAGINSINNLPKI